MSSDRPFVDLRRRRPDRRPRPPPCASSRAACASSSAGPDVSGRARALARAACGRSAAGSAAAAARPRPGRLLLRLVPGRARAAWRATSTRASLLVSATNGKTTTSAMLAACLERAGRPRRAQPRRVEHGAGAWPRRCSTPAAAAASSGCSRSTRPGCRPSPSELDPRLLLLSNLFRDQLDRYGELELLADRWAELVDAPGRPGALRAERRRPARRRPRPRAPTA